MQTHTFRLFSPAPQRHMRGEAVVQLETATPPALPGWVRAALHLATPTLAKFRRAEPWQLSLRVATGETALAANRQFRTKDYTPDVLTFPLWERTEGRTYAGDILLGWPVVERAAAAQGKPLKAHVQHLVIHSLLHLVGHDHLTPAEASRMEAQEVKLLAQLGWPNPYELPAH